MSSKDIEKLWKEYSPVSRPKKRVLSAGSKLEAMRAEEAVGNNKGGQEEILIEYQKSLQRVQL